MRNPFRRDPFKHPRGPWRCGWDDSAWWSSPTNDFRPARFNQDRYASGFRWGKRYRRLVRWPLARLIRRPARHLIAEAPDDGWGDGVYLSCSRCNWLSPGWYDHSDRALLAWWRHSLPWCALRQWWRARRGSW